MICVQLELEYANRRMYDAHLKNRMKVEKFDDVYGAYGYEYWKDSRLLIAKTNVLTNNIYF